MAIEKCCKNCSLEHLPHNDNCMWCKFWHEDNKKGKDLFTPKEELVRAEAIKEVIQDIKNEFWIKVELARKDEKHKFITLLKSDLENYEGLASEDMKNNNTDDLIGNNAVIRYIEETIEVLKEE